MTNATGPSWSGGRARNQAQLTKASEDAGRAITGRILVVGEADAKANGGVERGKVSGQGGVGDGLVVAPGVELAEGAGVGVAGVRLKDAVAGAGRLGSGGRERGLIRGSKRGPVNDPYGSSFRPGYSAFPQGKINPGLIRAVRCDRTGSNCVIRAALLDHKNLSLGKSKSHF